MENRIKILDWDSRFFGYKVASVYCLDLELNDLNRIIADLKKQDATLVYFFANPDDKISNSSLKEASGLLVDEKITFFTIPDVRQDVTWPTFVKPYLLTYASEKLKQLALQSGIYSRFRVDTNFHNNEFEKLYSEWIERSVKREIADEVLIYGENDDENGLITLAVKENKGSIGLIAVDEKERGKSVGRKLIQAAFLYFKEKKIDIVEVVTQMKNEGACRFYKSVGFEVKSVVNIYHLWIS